VRDARKYGDFATIEAVAAASDIPAIRRLLVRGANRMAAALVSAINVTDVPEVIIGGAHFAAVEEVFLPVVREAVSKCVLRRHVAPVTVRTASVGEEANAIGAGALVLHERLPRPPLPSLFEVAERSRNSGVGGKGGMLG
jgi:predicted NBD/HSP70 family sugar kinase